MKLLNIFRNMRKDEFTDEKGNLWAKNPLANVPLVDFIANGSKGGVCGNSQFIASTADINVATKHLVDDEVLNIAIIDFQALEKESKFFNTSTKEDAMKSFELDPNNRTAMDGYFEKSANFAAASVEFDILEMIPANCVKVLPRQDFINLLKMVAVKTIGYKGISEVWSFRDRNEPEEFLWARLCDSDKAQRKIHDILWEESAFNC